MSHETDTAGPVSAGRSYSVGIAIERDTAGPAAPERSYSVGTAVGRSYAHGVGVAVRKPPPPEEPKPPISKRLAEWGKNALLGIVLVEKAAGVYGEGLGVDR